MCSAYAEEFGLKSVNLVLVSGPDHIKGLYSNAFHSSSITLSIFFLDNFGLYSGSEANVICLSDCLLHLCVYLISSRLNIRTVCGHVCVCNDFSLFW